MSNHTFKKFNIIRKDLKGVTLLRTYDTKEQISNELTQGIYESNEIFIRHIRLSPMFRPMFTDYTVDQFLTSEMYVRNQII